MVNFLVFYFIEIFLFRLFRCPPCRGFTPVLAEFYKAHAESKNFELIFISSDRDEESFNEYYNEMPWLKLDFKDRTTKEVLGKQFQVSGIPTLILLDGDSGDVICTDARNQVQSGDAAGFPWKK